jgi:hypothetical protein
MHNMTQNDPATVLFRIGLANVLISPKQNDSLGYQHRFSLKSIFLLYAATGPASLSSNRALTV